MRTVRSFLRWLRGWLPKEPGQIIRPRSLEAKEAAGLLIVSLLVVSMVTPVIWDTFIGPQLSRMIPVSNVGERGSSRPEIGVNVTEIPRGGEERIPSEGEAHPPPVSEEESVPPPQDVGNESEEATYTKLYDTSLTVMFDEAHLPGMTIGSNPSECPSCEGGYSEFADLIRGAGFEVVTLDPGEEISGTTLSGVEVLAMVWPWDLHSSSELEVIEEFVKAGGGLLIIGEAFGGMTVQPGYVSIASFFGVNGFGGSNVVSDPTDSLEDPFDGQFWITLDTIAQHPVTSNVSSIEVYWASNLVFSKGTALVTTDDDAYFWESGEPASLEPVIAALEYFNGKIVVTGDANMWNNFDADEDGVMDLYEADNEVLALNAISWLASSPPEPAHVLRVTLDFPKVPVVLNSSVRVSDANGVVIFFLGSGLYDVTVPEEFLVPPEERTMIFFNRWSDGETSLRRVIDLDSDANLSATYLAQHLVDVLSTYGTPKGQGWYEEGATATVSMENTFRIEEGTRIEFMEWMGDETSSSSAFSFTVDSPKRLYVSWKTQYLLTVEKNPSQGVVDLVSGWFDKGSELVIQAEEFIEISSGDTRLAFTHWAGDISSREPDTTVVVDRPRLLVARWRTQHYLQVDVDPLGIADAEGRGWYDQGTTLTIGPAPQLIGGDTGVRYLFLSWILDGLEQVADEISVKIDSPHTATAQYTTQYTLTVEGRRLQPEFGDPQGEGWYEEGSTATFSVTSRVDFWMRNVFTGWSGDFTSTSPTATVVMDSPKTVTAIWRAEYTPLPIVTVAVVALVPVSVVLFSQWRKHRNRISSVD